MMEFTNCELCNHSPCPWSIHGQETMDRVAAQVRVEVENDVCPTNNVIRRRCYQLFVRLWVGVLGRGVRIELPECCLMNVRDEYPEDPYDPEATYMGHKDS